MSELVGIEELRLSPARQGPLPIVPLRLLNAVREYGPIEPVVVRRLGPHRFEILANVETWLAVQRVGQRSLPIEVREDVSDDEAAELVGLSRTGRCMDPIDEAEYLQELLSEQGGRSTRGATKRLAAMTGLTRTYISHALRLLDLPHHVQEMIRDGRLKSGHAKPLVTIKDRRLLLRLARKIENEGLSVRVTEELARNVRGGQTLPAPKPSKADPDILRLEQRVTDLIGCAASIDVDEGTLVLNYARDLEILDGLLRRLGYAEA